MTIVVEQVCNAINLGPPKPKDHRADGWDIEFTFMWPGTRFGWAVKGTDGNGLRHIPDAAGPEIRKIVEIIKGHLPASMRN